jgi:outer membrane protein assembly factor BamB
MTALRRLALLLSVLALTAALPALAVPIQPGDFLAFRSDTELVVIDHVTGTVTAIPSSFYRGAAAAANAEGDLVAADAGDSALDAPGFYQVDPDTGARTLLVPTQTILEPRSLALANDGTFFAGEWRFGSFGGRVYQIDAPTGTYTTLQPESIQLPVPPGCDPPFCSPEYLNDHWNPLGLAVGGDGDLFVLSDLEIVNPRFGNRWTQGVLRLDMATGDISLVALETPGVIQDYTQVGGLAMGPDGQLYLSSTSSPGAEGLYRIDPDTGAQSLFAAGVTGKLASDGAQLLLADATGIHSVDLVTGGLTTLFSGASYADLHSFSVVPEPASGLLLLVAAAALAVGRRARAIHGDKTRRAHAVR